MKARCTFILSWMVSLAVLSAGAEENHLAGESAAYLKRAASQPVDWYPYGKQAFGRAEKLDRPILLDVGATWCPWCVTMDKETYGNPEMASFINAHFVAVKVDYDAAGTLVAKLERAQAYLNLPAGLPLVAFLTPDGRLFDGHSYLPSQPKGNKPSFSQAAQSALAHFSDPKYLQGNSIRITPERITP